MVSAIFAGLLQRTQSAAGDNRRFQMLDLGRRWRIQREKTENLG
jgi:hypothetical protein